MDYRYFKITYVNIVKHLISFMWCILTLFVNFDEMFFLWKAIPVIGHFLFIKAFNCITVSYLRNKLFFLKTDFDWGRIHSMK